MRELEKTKEERGIMASLRRVQLDRQDTRAFDAYRRLGVVYDGVGRATAVLYAAHAAHEDSAGKLNFGGSCHRLTTNHARFPRDEKGKSSFDARFRRISACRDRDELAARLRQVLPLLRQEGIGLDYVRLYRDLRWWDDYADDIRWRWSQSYWGGPVESGRRSEATELRSTEAT